MIMDRHGAGRPSPAMVLFDIAGTLVGDTGLTMSAYRSVLEDEGMPFDVGWLRDRIGCQKLAVFAELLRMHDRDVVAAGRLADRFASSINASIRLTSKTCQRSTQQGNVENTPFPRHTIKLIYRLRGKNL